jgi:cyclophilin family peptidyl-prolyl cis-trans isomerase
MEFPQTVQCFVERVKSGFYNLGLKFYRVEPDFVIQTGSAESVGQPKSPQIQLEAHPDIRFNVPGVLGMTRAIVEERPETAGRQSSNEFFITLSETPHLDKVWGGFSAFGRVLKGLDVAKSIVKDDKLLGIEIQNS